jgi:hypothetical protein
MAHRQPDTSPNTPVPKIDVPARLIELLEHDPSLALSVLAVLEEAGIADGEFVRTQRARLSLARGDRGALIEHGASGAELTPQQAIDLLAEALSGAQIPEAAIVNAATLLPPLSQRAKGQLIAAIRASQDRTRSVSTLESLCVAAQAATADARQAIIDLGIELINKIASSAGEQTTRKNWTLRTMRACGTFQPAAVGRLVEAALTREVIYTYDLVHDQAISQLAVADEASLRQLVIRAESSADLTAASSLVGRVEDEKLRSQYLRLLLKQFGDQRTPSAEAASSVLPGLDGLVRLHEAAPEKPAASHDEALLGRWAALYPNVQALQDASTRIGLARSAHKPATQATAREAQRLAVAIKFIKEVVIPNDYRIVAIGGEKTRAAADAFDEFGESPPQWGEWLIKEKQVPLSAYKIPEQISSPKCVGVLVITNPASHAMTNQAKEAAEKAGRPLVWIEYATKKKIREGMKLLVEKIQQSSGQQQTPHRAPR